MDYDHDKLAERIKILPVDLQEAMVSVDTASRIQKISEKHGLKIDQSGNLADVISLIILGFIPSKNFVSELSKRADIRMSEATEIAKSVNTEIFDSIKDSLRKLQTEQEDGEEEEKVVSTPIYKDVKPISIPIPTPVIPITPPPKSIEEAGEFTLDKPVAPTTPSQYNETNLNREDILKSIEDENIPLVDHLLTTPVNNAQKPEEKVVESAPVIPKPPEVKKDFTNSSTNDPYREQI
jgi:hypothetical protein